MSDSPLFGEGSYRGPEQAPVTIIFLNDMACGVCGGTIVTPLQAIHDAYGDQVAIVFKHNPSPGGDRPAPTKHRRSQAASRAALAAHKQGQFWEFYALVFASHERVDLPIWDSNRVLQVLQGISEDNLTRYAQQLGLDMMEWHVERWDPQLLDQIIADQQAMLASGPVGFSSPVWFINGRWMVGGNSAGLGHFKPIIDAELEAANRLMAAGTPLHEVHRRRVRANLGANFDAYWNGFVLR